jgi:hypothetical protein
MIRYTVMTGSSFMKMGIPHVGEAGINGRHHNNFDSWVGETILEHQANHIFGGYIIGSAT